MLIQKRVVRGYSPAMTVQPGASFEMTAQRVIFLSSRSEDQAVQSQDGGGFSEQVDEDDIPF